MSVYIKGFPLPNNCGACPLRLAWCRERIYMVTRPERCPLIPVPDHGRLIDADSKTFPTFHRKELNDYMKGWNACLRSVQQQPTIIQASGGNENE